MAYDGTNAAVLSTMEQLLKRFYLPAMQDQLNNDSVLKMMLETNEKDVAGKEATIEHHYGRSSGTFAIPDGAALGDANYQKYKTSVVPMKYNYGRVAFSGPTIKASRSEKGSYGRVIPTEIKGIVKDVGRETNRQLWGCGYGILARWISGDTTSHVLQKKYTGNATAPDAFGSTFGAKYFEDNGSAYPSYIASVSTTVTVTAVGAVDINVSAITEGTTTDTITCTNGSVTEAAGTFWTRPNNSPGAMTSESAAGLGRREMMGLRGIVTNEDLDQIAWTNAGTGIGFVVNDPLQGLATGSYSWWVANVDSSATRYGTQRALTFDLIQKMFDKIEIKAGKGVGPNVMLTSHALKRRYLDLCQADRREVNTMKLDRGFEALDFNGIPFTADRDAIDGEIYFLTTSDLAIYRMSDYEWMDMDGNVLSRISGYDAYEAVLYRYAELGCVRRNSQGVLCDLAYDPTF